MRFGSWQVQVVGHLKKSAESRSGNHGPPRLPCNAGLPGGNPSPTSTPARTPGWLFRLLLVFALSLALDSSSSCLRAAEETSRHFVIPATDAEIALDLFSEQSGSQVIYLIAEVRGVSTSAVRGHFAPPDALQRLVGGTALRVRRDGKTGAFVVTRRPASPPEDSKQPHVPTPMHRTLIGRISAALALLAAGGASAQTTANSASTSTPDEAISLSPFRVQTERDTGYLAADSLVAGRLSTELLKTPSDVTVLTRDFLTDIGATDYQSAANFLTNAYVAPQQTADFGNNVTFRGLAGGFPTRNYFRYTHFSDYFSAERLEGSRGPNAVLFGDGVVGGMLNTLTKRAYPGRHITELGTRLTSDGGWRNTFDLNRSLGRDAAVRLNLLHDRHKNWIDEYRQDRDGLQLALTHRLTDRIELRFDGEIGKSVTNFAPQNVIDASSLWNGVALEDPAAATPGNATGLGRFTTDRLTFGPAFNGVVNLRNYGVSQGTGFRIDPSKARFLPNLPQVPEDFSVQPPNALSTIRYYVYSGFAEMRWTDALVSEFAFQWAKTKRAETSTRWQTHNLDVNRTLPGGAPNPYFGAVYTDAQPQVWDKDNEHLDFRLVTAYTLPVEAWKQSINVFLSRRFESFLAQEYQWGRSNGPVADLRDSSNLYYYRQYWRDRPRDLQLVPVDDGVYQWEKIRTRDYLQKQRILSGQIATSASFWQDRITYTGGYRRDEYHSSGTNINRRDARGRQIDRIRTEQNFPVNLLSSGVVVFPIKQWGLYANYSETYQPTAAGNLSLTENRVFDKTKGTGYSGGLRFNLAEGRFVGSLGYYNTTENSRIASAVPSSFVEINRIWDNLNQGTRKLPSDYRDTNDQTGYGYEFDFVANLSKNFRVRGNFAVPETKQTNSLPDTRRYVTENLPTWQAGLTAPGVTNPQQISSDIATIQSRLQASADGRRLNGQPDYSGSLFGNYTMDRSILKGVSFGGGVQFTGARIIGNAVDQPFNYIKSDTYVSVTLTAGYAFRVKGRNVRLQLNVNNALDNDDPYYTATRPFNGVNYADAFYYPEPRTFLLSATIDL